MLAESARSGRTLFGATRVAPIWLLVRLYLGYEWAHAGWEKVFAADPRLGFLAHARSIGAELAAGRQRAGDGPARGPGHRCVETLVGVVALERPYFYCPGC